MAIIDFPESVMRATEVNWFMDQNHNAQTSPFTGDTFAVRGMLERWRFTMRFKQLSSEDMRVVEKFFMDLEGPINTFRMRDPLRCEIGGISNANPVLDGAHSARERELRVTNWIPGLTIPGALKAGDWIEIGDKQLFKVTDDVDSTPSGGIGEAVIPVWPMLMANHADGVTVKASRNSPAYGIFRFTNDPGWSATVRSLAKPYSFTFEGVQEVIR